MKARSTGRYNDGFSTLEILIAFTILILCIGAVIMVVFGSQSVAVDTETNNEAIYKAQKVLEQARALSKQDFSSVVSTTTVSTSTIPYTLTLSVADLTQCKKQATSIVTWKSNSRPQQIELSSFFTDIAEALALGRDCDTEPLGDWDNPISDVSVGIGGQGATDIDVRNSFVYLTSSPSTPPKEDLFIYEFNSVALNLTPRGKINVTSGLNNIDIIGNYAFATNDGTSRHLMIFDISNPDSPNLVASSSLPDMAVGTARSIYYYDKKIYIGTQYLPCSSCPPGQNNEFHVFNVSNPTNPVWLGSRDVNNNVNDIAVRGNYAYLATSGDDREIVVLDISNPSNITQVGVFNAQDVPSGAGEDATALYLLGSKLYFGRERAPASRPDFYILDITNPASPISLGSTNLGLSPGAAVTGIIVKDRLAFVGTDNPTSGLKILNISIPSSIAYHTVCTALNFSENSTAIDMDGNFIFSANNRNQEIRLIRDQTATCTL